MNNQLTELLVQKREKRNQKLKALGIVYEESEQTLEESVQEYYKKSNKDSNSADK